MVGLLDLLDQVVRSQPDRTALQSADSRTTYAELAQLIARTATGIAQQHVHPGDLVSFWSDNRLQGVVALLALIRIGAQVAPLNPAMTQVEVDTLMERLNPDALLIVEGAPHEYPGTDSSVRRITATMSDAPLPTTWSPAADDIALIMFTAGSTGVPKAVPLTHRNVASSVVHIRDTYRLSPDDATLLAMPLCHGHGLIGSLLPTLASGGTASFPSSGRFVAHTFVDELRRARASWYTAAPTMHRIILSHADQSIRFPTLRFVRSCSEELPPGLAADLGRAFAAPVIPAYGMTETSHQTCSNPLPQDGIVDLATVGPPTGVQLAIRRDDGTPANDGEEGEIWVRGQTVAAGYRNPDAGDADAFADGWYHTGDLGMVATTGYLTISGRLKDVIDRGGEKIAPAEVEQALLTDTDVAAAAAFAVPDPVYGEHVAAAVVARPGHHVDTRRLTADVAELLPKAALPTEIHLIGELPLTMKGTLDRGALIRQFTAGEGEGR